MHEFFLAFIGGLFIGFAAVLLMATHGQIMGVSGIVRKLLPPTDGNGAWRLAFVAGVLSTPVAIQLFSQDNIKLVITDNLPLLIIGGLIVGFGTALGSGCTSGHGVCGLPRLSRRSIIATLVFMAAGFVTVFITRHVIGG